MDGFGDLPLNHDGLTSVHAKVDRILEIFVAKARDPDTAPLTALADAVRYLDDVVVLKLFEPLLVPGPLQTEDLRY